MDSYPDALRLFRCEFRPLECTQLLFSPVSPPYRGNTTSFDGVLVFGLVVFCFVVPFGVVVVVLLVFGWFLGFYLIIMLCFLPFNDDLGTPPTWRPRPWKKKEAKTNEAGGQPNFKTSKERKRSALPQR